MQSVRSLMQVLSILYDQIDSLRNLSALVITETELKLMATAAIMGDSKIPNIGYKTPAAIGTPSVL